MPFRLPNDTQHMAIIGQNGSGKTVFGAWALSMSSFMSQPKVIIDYKRDDLLAKIDGLRYIDFKEMPKHPGVYCIQANAADDEKMDDWFFRAAKRENIGIYLDEGLSVPQRAPRYTGLQTLLTQGRSKHCPVTVLMQRPAWVSKFIFSESSFFAVFRLQSDDDKEVVSKFTPSKRIDPLWNLDTRLEKYHCRWYDSHQNYSTELLPAPSETVILETFYDRMRLKRKVF